MVLSAALLSQTVLAQQSELNFWASRRAAAAPRDSAARPFLAQLPNLTAPLAGRPSTSPLSARFPLSSPDPRLGALTQAIAAVGASAVIEDVQFPSGKPNGAPIVVFIQDVHGHIDAQTNIAAALTGLHAQFPGAVIGIEAGAGDIDAAPFRGPRAGANRFAADVLLKASIIAGPEYAALSGDKPVPLYGVEDKSLYLANVSAVRRAWPLRDAMSARAAIVRARIDGKARAAFSPPLREFAARIDAREAGTLPLAEYLASLSNAPGVRSADYPELDRFLAAYSMEKRIDAAAVRTERTQLVRRLAEKLSERDLEALTAAGLALQTARSTPADFHEALRSAAQRAGVSLANFPHVAAYMDYVSLADRLNGERVLAETAAAEERAWATLTRSDDEKRVATAWRDARLLQKLASLTLSPAEWARAGERRDSLRSMAGLNLSAFEDFYGAAESRNGAIAERLLRRARIADAPIAVLVAGGFHKDGLRRRLLAAGAPVIVLSPRLTDPGDANAAAYLSVFTRERTPLSQIFDSPRLSLANTLAIAPIDPSVRSNADVVALAPELRAVNALRADGAGARFDGDVPAQAAMTGARVRFDGGALITRFLRPRPHTIAVNAAGSAPTGAGLTVRVGGDDVTVAAALTTEATYELWSGYGRGFVEMFIAPWFEATDSFRPVRWFSSHPPAGFWAAATRGLGIVIVSAGILTVPFILGFAVSAGFGSAHPAVWGAVVTAVSVATGRRLSFSRLRAVRDLNGLSADELTARIREAHHSGRSPYVSQGSAWEQLNDGQKKYLAAGVLVLRKIDGEWRFLLGERAARAQDQHGMFSVPVGGVTEKPATDPASGADERDALAAMGISSPVDVDASGARESVPEAAVRELFEETGIRARVGQLAGRVNDFRGNRDGVLMNVLIYVDASTSRAVKGNGELENFQWVPLSDLFGHAFGPVPGANGYLARVAPGKTLTPSMAAAGVPNIYRLFSDVAGRRVSPGRVALGVLASPAYLGSIAAHAAYNVFSNATRALGRARFRPLTTGEAPSAETPPFALEPTERAQLIAQGQGIADFLGDRSLTLPGQDRRPVDDPLVAAPDLLMVFGVGNELLGERAADLFLEARKLRPGVRIVFAGGVGRATPPQWVAQGRSEAQALSEAFLARVAFLAPDLVDAARAAIILEDKSTNSGQNVAFTLARLAALGVHPTSILVIHNPLFQLRSALATWLRQSGLAIPATGFAPYRIDLTRLSDAQLYAAVRFSLGEIDRLRNYPAQGFTVPVALASVESAEAALLPVLAAIDARHAGQKLPDANELIGQTPEFGRAEAKDVWSTESFMGLVARRLPASAQDRWDVPNHNFSQLTGKPVLSDHLQLMVDGLNHPWNLGQIPPTYRAILADPANRNFFEIFILLHDWSKRRMFPTVRRDRLGLTVGVGYPGHEGRSAQEIQDDPELAQLLDTLGADRSLFLEVVHFHGLPGILFGDEFVRYFLDRLRPGIDPKRFFPLLIAAAYLDSNAASDPSAVPGFVKNVDTLAVGVDAWMLGERLASLEPNSVAVEGQPFVKDPAGMERMSRMFRDAPGQKPTAIQTDIVDSIIGDFPPAFEDRLEAIVKEWVAIVGEENHYEVGKKTYHVNLSVAQDIAKNASEGVGILKPRDTRLSAQNVRDVFDEVHGVVRGLWKFNLKPKGVRIGADGGLIFVFEHAPAVAAFRDRVVHGVRRSVPGYVEGRPKPLIHITLHRMRRQFVPTKDQADRINAFFEKYREVGDSMPEIPVDRFRFGHETQWMNEGFDLELPLVIGEDNASAAAELNAYLERTDWDHPHDAAPAARMSVFRPPTKIRWISEAYERVVAPLWESPVATALVFALPWAVTLFGFYLLGFTPAIDTFWGTFAFMTFTGLAHAGGSILADAFRILHEQHLDRWVGDAPDRAHVSAMVLSTFALLLSVVVHTQGLAVVTLPCLLMIVTVVYAAEHTIYHLRHNNTHPAGERMSVIGLPAPGGDETPDILEKAALRGSYYESNHAAHGAFWRGHVEESRRMIIDGISRVARRDAATVLGVSAARDIPLAELARAFDVVNIVDIDEPSLRAAIETVPADAVDDHGKPLRDKLNPVIRDVSGGASARLIAQGREIIRAQPDAARARADVFALIDGFDPVPDLSSLAGLEASYVISSGLSSQLSGAAEDVLLSDLKITELHDGRFGAIARRARNRFAARHADVLAALLRPGGLAYWSDTIRQNNPRALTADQLDRVLLALQFFMTATPWADGLDGTLRRAIALEGPIDLIQRIPELLAGPLTETQALEMLQFLVDRVREENPNAGLVAIDGGLEPLFAAAFTADGAPGRWQWFLHPNTASVWNVEAHFLRRRGAPAAAVEDNLGSAIPTPPSDDQARAEAFLGALADRLPVDTTLVSAGFDFSRTARLVRERESVAGAVARVRAREILTQAAAGHSTRLPWLTGRFGAGWRTARALARTAGADRLTFFGGAAAFARWALGFIQGRFADRRHARAVSLDGGTAAAARTDDPSTIVAFDVDAFLGDGDHAVAAEHVLRRARAFAARRQGDALIYLGAGAGAAAAEARLTDALLALGRGAGLEPQMKAYLAGSRFVPFDGTAFEPRAVFAASISALTQLRGAALADALRNRRLSILTDSAARVIADDPVHGVEIYLLEAGLRAVPLLKAVDDEINAVRVAGSQA